MYVAQRYSGTPNSIEALRTWAKSGEVARLPLVYEIIRIGGMATTSAILTDRLREYRSALITAAETWKIVVQGAAA